MKKLFFILLAAMCTFSAFGQTQGTRKLRAWQDGAIVWQYDASLVDSLNFFIDTEQGGNTGGGTIDDTKQIYVGVVAFNKAVNQLPITSELAIAKTFITNQTNDQDFTAFAYSVSKGDKMFDAAGLPEFDKIFMLNFSDGTDNYSNMLWGMEGRMVSQANVYDTARYDLSKRIDLNSYAIGFGDDVGFSTKMKKVVIGSGEYRNAVTSADLQSTFNRVAQSIIASAKNVVLTTNPGFYSADMGYKYFRFELTADNGLTDNIYAKMEGNPTQGFTLSITKAGNYAQFDAPARGTFDQTSGKVLLPLNNLKFVVNGNELQFNIKPYVSFEGEIYYEDVEEASTESAISKRIAIVLVLDCSKSMGDAFVPMKNAAIDFIKTLENMDPNAGSPDIPGVMGNVTYVLNGGITNDFGWTSPQDMYNTLNADWNAFSGTSTEWKTLDQIKGDPAAGIPIQAASMDAPFLADDNFKLHFTWLMTYMNAKCTEAGVSLALGSSALRYNLGAFFADAHRTAWPVGPDYTLCGVSNYKAYASYWKGAFANPTHPTTAFVLNEPYREGYTFDGWYTTPNFSDNPITVVDANTIATLYAKWKKKYLSNGTMRREISNDYCYNW